MAKTSSSLLSNLWKSPKKTDPIQASTLQFKIFAKTKTRYVKVVLKGTIIPDGTKVKGTPALLFVDEIQLNLSTLVRYIFHT